MRRFALMIALAPILAIAEVASIAIAFQDKRRRKRALREESRIRDIFEQSGCTVWAFWTEDAQDARCDYYAVVSMRDRGLAERIASEVEESTGHIVSLHEL